MLHAIATFLIAFTAAIKAWAAPAIEIYGQDAEISNVQVSSDGQKLALVKSEGDDTRVYILPRRGGDLAKPYVFGASKIRGIEWSGPNHVLVYVSQTGIGIGSDADKYEVCGVYAIDTRHHPLYTLLLSEMHDLGLATSICSVKSRLWNESGDVLIAVTPAGKNSSLFRVSADTGKGRTISRGGELTNYWVTSPKGYVIARIDYGETTNRYRILVPTNKDRLGRWKTVFADELEIPNLQVFGASLDEESLIVSTRQKSGYYALFELSLKDGMLDKPLFEPDGVDLSGVIHDPYTGAIVGATYAKEQVEQIFFQNDLQAVSMAVRQALPDWSGLYLVSWDRRRETFVFFAESNKSAGDYFIFDRTQERLEHFVSTRSELSAHDIAPVRAFQYKARDGLIIQAFLTMPNGRENEKLPLVVYPHGGPASRDTITFDYLAQALATRGYAVLQMNFRGSTGYGEAFEEAGYGEWGGKMQDDVTDAVRHIISKGIVDPSRICIVGASYGGYTALAAVAYTPELYRCAVSVAGVSDLQLLMNEILEDAGEKSAAFSYWKRWIGDPRSEREKIESRSPVNAVNRIIADVMLIHGKDDTVVPIVQSELMYEALVKAGKSPQLVKLEGEDHWLSTAKTRTEMLKAMDGFLAKHLGR